MAKFWGDKALITTLKPGYVEDMKLLDASIPWGNIPEHLAVRIKVQKYPIGFYIYKLAGQRVLEVTHFFISEDYRRLRHGSELMEHIIGNALNVNWLRVIVREDVEVGVCKFLQAMKFKGRLVGENYHFERRIS